VAPMQTLMQLLMLTCESTRKILTEGRGSEQFHVVFVHLVTCDLFGSRTGTRVVGVAAVLV
jgi:hypothetical protein